MRPNIDKKFEHAENILFECQCKNSHYFEVIQDRDDPDISFYFVDRPRSLWHTLKVLWTYKKFYHSDIILNYSDIKALQIALSKYLLDYEAKRDKVHGDNKE